MTIIDTIKYTKLELSNLYPKNEIQSFIYIIFEHLLKYSKIEIHTRQNEILSDENDEKIQNFILDLKAYRPIQHIIGSTEFYGLSFMVNKSVLIPRQETEELIELIIKENKTPNLKILDVGTGSGCIAISLAKNLEQSHVSAYDISKKALSIAQTNAKNNNVSINFQEINILNFSNLLNEKFDIIVSNPPYVTEKEKNLIQANVLDYEPHLALFVSDLNPLIFYNKIADFAQNNLKISGKLYFEINENYGTETKDLLDKKGYKNIKIIKDINGKNRIVSTQK